LQNEPRFLPQIHFFELSMGNWFHVKTGRMWFQWVDFLHESLGIASNRTARLP
jgi:hypothetical protein